MKLSRGFRTSLKFFAYLCALAIYFYCLNNWWLGIMGIVFVLALVSMWVALYRATKE